ncbi:hypothetical protein M409DRAFT_20339 [Zasmidium cellare ATCC 36951]|uniref:F-box domain-containing protein n=1 Tax=Zasmidium cellare ATCC 36951 TaxID=1080233 RepID=A0A6A6CPW7_ZASCE|nr:uncharacterized protein M409DRAFT_20339 [Zasmidium cellare ATCC 36951]KAF2169111.1 hypothetical protein M409DRAFT_20339 [Zasmidium cellare ATCC 36951]
MARHQVTVPSGPPQPQPRCHLFRVPAELRNSIYSLALAVTPDQYGQVAIRRQRNKSDSILQLLGTCRLVYQEASSLFYSEHKLRIGFLELGYSQVTAADFKILGNIALYEWTAFVTSLYLRKLSALQTLAIKIESDERGQSLGGSDSWLKNEMPLLRQSVSRLRSVQTFRFLIPDELTFPHRDDWQKALGGIVAALPSNKRS